jgi:hypothetical protein
MMVLGQPAEVAAGNCNYNCCAKSVKDDRFAFVCALAGWGYSPEGMTVHLMLFLYGVSTAERKSLDNSLRRVARLKQLMSQRPPCPRAEELFADAHVQETSFAAVARAVTGQPAVAAHTLIGDVLMRMTMPELKAFALWDLESTGWCAPV